MMSENYIRFPKEYPLFYVDMVNDWWDGEEYSSIQTNRHTDFLTGGTEEDIAFVFSSEKLGKGKGYALMALVFSIIDSDAYIRGLIHLGTYSESPNEVSKNKAYIEMIMNSRLDSFQDGERFYIGEGDNMDRIKELIEAWMVGEVGVYGSLPDYDFVRMI